MEYTLVLVEQGNIVGRQASIIHAHSEASHVLPATVAGVGKKGETVRLPHPLEDPLVEGRENPGGGVELALAFDYRDPDTDRVATRIVQRFGPANLTADTLALAEYRERLKELEAQVNAQHSAISDLNARLNDQLHRSGNSGFVTA